MAEKWEQEDRDLTAKGINNPWDKFPAGRPRNWLHARSTLVKSEGTAEIRWLTETTERVSQQIVEREADLQASRITLVRERDMLTEVLGQLEQTGHVRGVSSYFGRKYWPDCTSMYRKRKRSNVDMEAIKEEVRSQLTIEVTAKVTRDIMDMLREHGVPLVSPSNTTTSVGGRQSSCASASDAVCNAQLDKLGVILDPNVVDLLTDPTACTLIINPRGKMEVVATGRVFPKQTELYSPPVQDGYVVVHVDFVYQEHEGIVLNPPLSGEITNLGEALFKRV
jgi:hypothetical protein